MVGTQAVMNVISGQRYKMVPKEIKDYVLGHYGQAPAKIDPEVKQTIIGDAEVVTVRPADLIEPQAKDYLGRREDPYYDVPVQTVEVSLDLQ